MIQNTVIGIVLFGGMFLLGNFLIPGGVFGGDITYNGNGVNDEAATGSGSTKDEDGAGTGTVFTAATYNIKCTDDCGGAEVAWDSTRATAILNYLKSVDVAGIEEGRETSISWLTSRLNNAGYQRTENEWARQVFWKKSVFRVVKQGVKELDSEKDLVWVKLQEVSSGQSIYYAVTHLDVTSSSRRIDEANKATSFMNSALSDAPIIFVENMNSEPGSKQDAVIKSAGFKDAYDVAKSKIHTSYKTTVSNFSGKLTGKIDTSDNHQIDHIYVKGNLSVSRVEVVAQKGSDHLPVEADIVIPTKTANKTTVRLSGVSNFRDAGDSGYIKTGVLYRSANLNSATSEDVSKLSTLLKNGKLIDLRQSTDSRFKDDPTLDNVTNVQIPIKGESSSSGYIKSFIDSPTMRGQFGKALAEIASSTGPVQVHCKQGKDRTGWLIALAMMSVGISKDSALKEYLKSPDVDAGWFNAAYAAAVNKDHTGGSGKVFDFITRGISDGGLGVSQNTINALKSKLKK